MLLLPWLLIACAGPSPEAPTPRELVVLHAGSLSVPFAELEARFEAAHPGVDVVREAAGSRATARKISDLGREADIMASADISVIDTLLVPEHASWSLPFATNEMVLAYRPGAPGSEELAGAGWVEAIAQEGVAVGRSDPDQDPCGYRTLFVLHLAEDLYSHPGLAEQVTAASARYVRPKETDLLALLETGELDYLFIYRSVAIQHELRWIPLPPEVNLGDPAQADRYATASVSLSGRTPGEKILKRGAPMVYGVTRPLSAPEPALAADFLALLFDPEGGGAVLEAAGQPPVRPSPDALARLPAELRASLSGHGTP